MMIRKDFAGSFDVGLGPQIIYGFATAKGTINWNDSDTMIAFNGSANGFGIGINVGADYKITKHLFCGLSFGIVYFGISEASIPIVGHNNSESSDSSNFLYTGEYISLSPRIVVGYEF
jgi:outer membrane protein W